VNFDEVAWRETSEGVLLPLKAQPGARNNAIKGVHAGRLKVAVTAAPEKGKANRLILQLLADRLGVRKCQLELVQGQTSGEKTVLIRGTTIDALRKRLAEI